MTETQKNQINAPPFSVYAASIARETARSYRAAIVLGLLAIVLSGAAGFGSYLLSRDAMIDSIVSHNRIVADTLSSYADQQPKEVGDPNQITRVVHQKWERIPRNDPSIYMCIIGPDAKLMYHSLRTDRIGSPAGKVPIAPGAPGGPATVEQLLVAKQDWAGENVNLAGKKQLAAYSYSSRLDGLFVVHTPAETYEAEVRAATIPWAIGYGVSVLALWPVSLLLLQRTFRSASRTTAEATRALADSEERYRSFVQCSGEGIYLCEFDEPMPIDLPEHQQIKLLATACHFAACNDVFAHMYGYHSGDEMIGMRAIDVYGTAESEANNAFLRAMIRNNYRIHDAISEEFDKDGNRVYFRNSCVGIVEDGKLTRVWGTQRDITDQVNAEAKLKEKEQELRHVARLSTMGEMVAGIAHEINQPLYAIGNYALACDNTLKQPDVKAPESLRESVYGIIEANSRAGNIIKRIRNLVSKGSVTKAVADVDELVSEAIQFMEFEARRQSVTVETDFCAAGAKVSADTGAIQQVVLNLLRNAFESLACVPESQRLVRVSTSQNDGTVAVSIQDNGPGVPEELQATLFDPFVTSKPDGMGIGLAISQSIIQVHGGELTLDSTEEGASFQFTLPVARDQDVEVKSEASAVAN